MEKYLDERKIFTLHPICSRSLCFCLKMVLHSPHLRSSISPANCSASSYIIVWALIWYWDHLKNFIAEIPQGLFLKASEIKLLKWASEVGFRRNEINIVI